MTGRGGRGVERCTDQRVHITYKTGEILGVLLVPVSFLRGKREVFTLIQVLQSVDLDEQGN